MKQREHGGEHPALSNDPEKEETGKEENEMEEEALNWVSVI